MIHIYYLTLIVAVSLGSSYITSNLPALKRGFKRLLTRSNPKPPTPAINQIVIDLNNRVGDLEDQVDNLASQLASRDRNRKSNIRRDVREYLEELRTDK